jgi:hypothetical protein
MPTTPQTVTAGHLTGLLGASGVLTFDASTASHPIDALESSIALLCTGLSLAETRFVRHPPVDVVVNPPGERHDGAVLGGSRPVPG